MSSLLLACFGAWRADFRKTRWTQDRRRPRDLADFGKLRQRALRAPPTSLRTQRPVVGEDM
eukprot:2623880-Prymnesium_polylepis.1